MYLLFHANVVLVKGATRSIICDLQNEQFYLIPNSFATFIKLAMNKSLQEINESYSLNERETITEYLKWMDDRDMIVWIPQKDTLDYFPEMNMKWDSPFVISNIIIDTCRKNIYWERIIAEINLISIPFLQLRFFQFIGIETLDIFLKPTQVGFIKGIELIIPFNPGFTTKKIKTILEKNIRIYQIVFYNSTKNQSYQCLQNSYPVTIIHTTEENITEKHCGFIESYQFRTNKRLYTESLKHNTCLNRKISVDQEGTIKNCPSMKHSFGNIKDTSFEEVINQKEFKISWSITKDKISICKDCEFRHVCTDCRAYLQNPDDIYSKPLKCGYDPYTNEWEEWSTNPLSKKGIEYYGMQDFLKQTT